MCFKRLSLFCVKRTDSTLRSRIANVRVVSRSPARLVVDVIASILVACVLGLFLHFVPCIWWTCDWGDHDGEGVRGAIWFVVWGAGVVWAIVVAACLGSAEVVVSLVGDGKEIRLVGMGSYESARNLMKRITKNRTNETDLPRVGVRQDA